METWRSAVFPLRSYPAYGLSEVLGKVFRIGHLGDLNELMLASAIVGSEMAMLDAGIQVTPGSGIAAASEYWRETAAPLAARG